VTIPGPQGANTGVGNFESVSTDEASINDVAARIELTTNQPLQSGSFSEIAFDQVGFKHADVVDADIANNQIVVKKPGTYFVSVSLGWARTAGFSAGDEIAVTIDVDGSSVFFYDGQHGGADEAESQSVSGVVTANAGSIITSEARQGSGQQEDLRGDSFATSLSVGRLG
jgi:hypothetical protein